jgi:CRISPR-associated protein Cas2
MFVVVSYDIEDNKRRSKVCNELKNYGEHIQYSVFECDISQIQIKKLQTDLKKIINQRQDSIRYYFLCQKCLDKVSIQGRKFSIFS